MTEYVTLNLQDFSIYSGVQMPGHKLIGLTQGGL